MLKTQVVGWIPVVNKASKPGLSQAGMVPFYFLNFLQSGQESERWITCFFWALAVLYNRYTSRQKLAIKS